MLRKIEIIRKEVGFTKEHNQYAKHTFNYLYNFITLIPKNSCLSFENAEIQTHDSAINEYKGNISLKGITVLQYVINADGTMYLSFKANNSDDISCEKFLFKREDKIEQLLTRCSKYEVSKEVYEFFVKL